MATNPNELLARRAWLHMLAEGGRWTPRELAMDMGATATNMANVLAWMYDTGLALRHSVIGRPTEPSYSVGDPSEFPRGLTLRDVRAALQKAGETV